MRLFKTALAVLLLSLFSIFSSPFICCAKVKLTADNMTFDTATGLLVGLGNVTLIREDLKVVSDRCEGSYRENTARMWQNVRAEGTWSGENLSFQCQELNASFSKPERISMVGSVEGRFGSRSLRCYDVEMIGDRFIATKVSRFQDDDEGISLSCDRVKGAIGDGMLREFEANGSVKMEIKHLKDGTLTKISGGKALYSKDRGSIVMSGGAVAVQRGRKITAKNVVFYPATSKIEAKGSPKITFDVE
ncbi:hypothetical protein L2W58_10350 [Dethiosulfovibrio sp. F2B]|uniref:LptA/OstA family protein n=1 Tax=Dethiosulfovibrio faecalis TaxID=2720018 RepID=UPI001F3BAB3D|nr:LptA/OstA family protein [Dethiosulfovibrio faecalis]MCF4152196.1 hypothetical protein [Dethiosulfovibrio faecalis]